MKNIVLIPSYKPNLKLIKTVEEIQNKLNVDIVIVDDGGKEEYLEYFKVCQIKGCIILHHEENKGKGAALKTGINFIKENYSNIENIITVDADGQHSPDDILKLIKKSEDFNGLILGVRDFNQKNVPLKSKIGNKFSSIYLKLVTNKNLNDTQTGLRLIPKNLFNLALNTNGERYEYEMNFLLSVLSKNHNFSTVEIQTIYYDNNSHSHFNVFRDSFLIYKSFFTYIFIAILSFIVDISWFYLIYIFSKSIIFSTICARLISGIFNYLLNSKFIFQTKQTLTNFKRYFILFFTQMILSAIILNSLKYIPISIFINKTIVDLLLFITSYFIQSNWVFKKAGVSYE